ILSLALLIHHTENALNVTLQNQVTQLLNYVSSLPSPAAVPPAPPVRKSPVSMPEKFSGQTDMFPAFLGQCQLFMSLRPENFPNDRAKTGFILSLLSGQAANWATPLLVQDSDKFLYHLEPSSPFGARNVLVAFAQSVGGLVAERYFFSKSPMCRPPETIGTSDASIGCGRQSGVVNETSSS
uniref:DUF4939 domain-containing protein n=1 Tax=Pseudonaja textilis TaxID=8673 RepID=A0A670ZE05_PSETE